MALRMNRNPASTPFQRSDQDSASRILTVFQISYSSSDNSLSIRNHSDETFHRCQTSSKSNTMRAVMAI
ncbi:uncharacterized protein METZ01_LOCUS436163 [marine metagenome]|uniref:Uncharacterized protein n=1 Tax=marine metagenome TaxID=408172 RepID=A0A382YK12_9ZZZZ